MKTCAYCGRQNEDAAPQCQQCGTNEFKELPPTGAGNSAPLWPWGRRSARRKLLSCPWPQQWEECFKANVAHYPLLSGKEQLRLRDIVRVLISEKVWEGC